MDKRLDILFSVIGLSEPVADSIVAEKVPVVESLSLPQEVVESVEEVVVVPGVPVSVTEDIIVPCEEIEPVAEEVVMEVTYFDDSEKLIDTMIGLGIVVNGRHKSDGKSLVNLLYSDEEIDIDDDIFIDDFELDEDSVDSPEVVKKSKFNLFKRKGR